jgi:hypothetical protein
VDAAAAAAAATADTELDFLLLLLSSSKVSFPRAASVAAAKGEEELILKNCHLNKPHLAQRNILNLV